MDVEGWTRVNGNYLLDTNAVIVALASQVDFRVRLGANSVLLLPVMAVGELFYGAFRSAQTVSNIARIEQLIAASNVVPCDSGTASEYGRVKQSLAAKGRPIPGNHVWIAALALQHDLTLVTRDAHFQYVDSLIVQAW